ncbi:MAG: DNA polymerase I [Lachnospiraceae bacterium]|nr:DNA polymerase I [Lachnospiraceae bacterium]MEE0959422.1 DNA polymerase I [Lachnospiraceae bacterium]
MSEKLLLIDGHSILNRAFYGVPPLNNAAGIPTNAIYGFLNIMFKIIDEEKPDYITVAFDLKEPTFRHKMYAEYKGTRKPMPEELHKQVPLIKETLKAMGIKTVELAGYEADDLLGTLAGLGEKKGLDVSVLSGDRDLLQLATKKVKIRIPKTKKGQTEIEDYYEDDVVKTYGVTPVEFIDLKALMGDTADNIPGVPGVGEKTATAIITEYKNIENAYANVENIKPARAKNSLSEHYDMAVLSKKLATINVEAPIEYNFEEAKTSNFYTPEAYELFKKYEFKSMLLRFDSETVADANDEVEYREITEFAEINNFFDNIIDNKMSVALELTGDTHIRGISVTTENETAYIEECGFFTSSMLEEKVYAVVKNCKEIYFSGLKEQLHLLDNTYELENKKELYDTEIGSYILNPNRDSYEYDSLYSEYNPKRGISSRTDILAKMTPQAAYEKDHDAFVKYVTTKTYAIFTYAEKINEQIKADDMWKLYTDIEMPLVYVLYEMQKNGIRVNKEELKEYGDKLQVRIEELEQSIHRLADDDFNINSPKQLGEVLFVKMGLPNGKKTKTGYSTSADVLEKIKNEHEIVPQILEYRQLVKLKSTYADGLENYICDDGRIHGKFNQTITATGRISSTDPNLQNIPIRMELGREIRKVFVPEEGYRFVDADYSQIELRVLAHMSDDRHLIEAYNSDEDIHKITASQVFKVPLDEVTPRLRSNAKAVNFGIVYGISSFGLSEDLSISKKEAAEYIKSYFENYGRVKEFMDETVEHAKENGYVVTLFNRRRPVPELKSGNFMTREFGKRIAMNSPIQGTAADIIKIAMINVYKRLKRENLKSRLLLQIHDELLIEALDNEIVRVKQIMEEEMVNAVKLKVALQIDMHEGNSWFDAK